MNPFILPKEGQTSLLVIDIQERLYAVMPEEEIAPMLRNTHLLLEVATHFDWSTFYTEQYPKGLGATQSSLLEKLRAMKAVGCEKLEFSAARNETFKQTILPRLMPNVVVVGMEAHVCVMQTVLDLQARGCQCFVPYDAVASREPANKENALALMEKAGAIIVNTESLMFFALQKAGTDTFRHFSKLIR